MTNQTHFGFKTVDSTEKASMVRGVFDSVASNYDIMNDVMSFGLHRLWKRELIAQIAPRADMHLLDVAGGTGDIAFRFLDAGGGEVTVCDINQNMLNEGRNRAIDTNRLTRLEWVTGNAESLPFPDMHFDAYSIAFGIRNVTDIPAALREARRVLKPGGRFFCLEFTPVSTPLLGTLYDTYSFHAIPRMGQLIAGDRESYQYLVESIRRFPDAATFADMIKEAGLAQVNHRTLAPGIVALHSGWRI